VANELSQAEKDADASFWYTDVGVTVSPCSSEMPPKVVSSEKDHWVEIAMVDSQGNAIPGEAYEITIPDGQTVTGNLDERGIARLEGIDPGTCIVRFPGLDKASYKKL
jgi:hypothetical protein